MGVRVQRFRVEGNRVKGVCDFGLGWKLSCARHSQDSMGHDT